jgi:hypothetical protein
LGANNSFILGINYWPRRKAMFWWSDYDRAEVQEEFASLKPHTEVLRRFAATAPTVRPAQRPLVLDTTPEEYYQDPASHARRLYGLWREE